ncbi:MAG: hypothetical protein IJ930_06740 [Lachnospiraceae bacterium]|nr:hypothetical protein [Lachnospiraceae bacterium]
MSAGICIMNRNAIAMAADSAVTIGDHAAIHNSANKLFSLSRVAPVGVIVYANAALMTVPIEIIVKQYKKHLGDRVFQKLNDYVDDFLDYLSNKSHYFRFDINEQAFVLQIFSDLMCGLLGDYKMLINSEQSKVGKPLDENALQKVAESAVNATISFINGIVKRTDYNFAEYIKIKYLNTFIDMLKQDSNLQWLTDEQIQQVCNKSCELYDTDFDRGGFVGVAIAGYGEEEIYPHLVHLHIGGVINSKLKYSTIETVEISESTIASIAPLAQTDVMQTFLFGINDQFINDLAKEIPKQIDECFNSINDSCFVEDKKNEVCVQLKSVTGKIIKHMTETAGNNYMRPIIQSVASLPIEELALLAESMINITSLRRKVAIDNNIGTVGGPIDVSIITKGDGFIWLKRKHYFDRKYNPQYFYSHFEKQEEAGCYDAE